MYMVIGVTWIDESEYSAMREVCQDLPKKYSTWQKRTMRLIANAGRQSDFVVLVPMTQTTGCISCADLHEKAMLVAAEVGITRH